MKPRAGEPDVPAQTGGRLVWAAYAAGFLAFAAGLMLLVAGRFAPGVGLSLAGTALASLAYMAPSLPLKAWAESLKAAAARPAAPTASARPGRGPKAAPGTAQAPASELAPAGLPRLALGAVLGLLDGLDPSDQLSVNRLYLLAPAVVLLVAAAGLSIGSTVQGIGAFAASLLVLAVYFQDMAKPMVVHRLRQNCVALLAQLPALPFQLYGIYDLNSRYENPAYVWAGFFVCAAASGYMFYAMRRWPFDFSEPEAARPSLAWTPPRPFLTLGRWSLILGLLAGAALSACLAVFVFPADHAGLSVALGFAAMALLIASFPWIPGGLAFAPSTPPALSAGLAVLAASVAFALGAHGQDQIERGLISSGLWYFLAGGVALVLVLSRFGTDRGAEDPAEPSAWPRLEVAAVLALVALSFCFRIWHLGSFPFGVEGDEGGGGLWANDVLTGNVENHLIHQNYPLAFFSVTAFIFKVAGISIASMRFHAVLFGTLSVATAYFFFRLNMGRAAAFLATVLMSFSYWHLHYSRFGHYNIEQVAVQMAAFYFVFKAFRTGKLWQWAVGGLAFGLAMFPHMAGRILPFQGIALVLFLGLLRRDLLRRHLPGFLAFLTLAWAISSPAVVYWNRARGLSMGRIQSVSIFDKNNTNAPIDTLAGFVRNCKVSMLMFNYEGDTRTRDNPVAPDKILEHWTAVLFGLAFLYLLYHWREPVNFFLLSVFFMNLAASAFSVEAPQTLRTAGNIPIVFAFMAVPLSDLFAALRRGGRLPLRAVYIILLAGFAFFSYRSARRLFVDSKRMSFDTSATFIAQVAGQQGGPDTYAVFWGTGFASSHPPMLLFKLQTPLRNFYAPYDDLPVTIHTESDNLLFFADDYQQIVPMVRWMYPKAVVSPIRDQEGYPDVAQYVRVNKSDLLASEGLDGKARLGGKTLPVAGIESLPAKGLEGARAFELSGSVAVDDYGTYAYSVSGEGDADVKLDGKTAFTRRDGRAQTHPLLLAKGLHAVSLRMDPRSGADSMRLRRALLRKGPVKTTELPRNLAPGDVDRSHLLQAPPSGFYGQYYVTFLPQGDPVFEVVEPIVLNHWLDSPLPGNWSARWRTRFKVGTAGDYAFSVRGGIANQVSVDGKLVWRQGQPTPPEARPRIVLPSVKLSPGWHDYEAVFCTNGGPATELRWTPPDGKESVFWVPDMQPLR